MWRLITLRFSSRPRAPSGRREEKKRLADRVPGACSRRVAAPLATIVHPPGEDDAAGRTLLPMSNSNLSTPPGLNETHDPILKSWVESANDPATEFPIQNLPLCAANVERWSTGPQLYARIG